MALIAAPDVNADTYITLVDANAYFGATLKESVWSSYTTSQKEAALRLATRHLDSEDWKGERAYTRAANALRMPRRNLYDRDGELLSSLLIPAEVQIAAAELALQLLAEDAGSNTSQTLEALEVGSIKLTYGSATSASGSYTTRYPSIVQSLIAPYLLPTRFGSSATLVRA